MAEPVDPDLLAADLRVVAVQLIRQLRTATHGSHQPALSMSQLSVLGRLIADGPASASALAAAEGVRPQSMAATLASLEADGLVTRQPHATDRRQVVLHPTDAARTRLDAARRSKEAWLSAALSDRFDPAELAEIAHAVALLRRLVG